MKNRSIALVLPAIVFLGAAAWVFGYGWKDAALLLRSDTSVALSDQRQGDAQLDAEAYEPDLLLVEHDTVDQHKIDVKMGDWYFTVPVNRADTIFQENRFELGEINGFTFVGNWPGFSARSPENITDFLGLSNEYIRVTLERICERRGHSPRSTPCSASRSISILYDIATKASEPGIAGQDFYPRSELPDFFAAGLAGYDLAGFVDRRRADEKILGSENDLNIYLRNDDEGRIDFAKCLRKTKGFSCTHHFIWRDFFKVRIFYAVQYQSQWPEIKQAVLATLDDMITPAADYVPPTPPWCDRIPFPRPPELRVPGNVKKSMDSARRRTEFKS